MIYGEPQYLGHVGKFTISFSNNELYYNIKFLLKQNGYLSK